MTIPASPATRAATLAAALQGSQPLAALLQRVRESRARFDAVADLLPAGLRETTRPGPLDDVAWVLLAPHAAGASKLRQLLPALTERLTAGGWAERPIRVKVRQQEPAR